MIFAIALSSNSEQHIHFPVAYRTLLSWGNVTFSDIFQIPCRDGIGADYWNSACLLSCQFSFVDMEQYLKDLEYKSGRIRPSHQISLDLDIVAWGEHISQMQFNVKKLPLALDIVIPLSQLWYDIPQPIEYHDYPIIKPF